MRHQVERPKHVAPKHGVKPVCALTAALVAVAMMATMAVTSLTPSRNANAANENSGAGIYTPKSVSLGTDTGDGTEDTGIATYVGGDMYVGQKVSGDMKNPSGPAGSYAAEAEGLTAVNGKLLLHPLKGVWATYYTDADGAMNGRVKDYRGFRFGIVGFGGQYRPKDGSSVLEVKGASLNSAIDWVGGAQAWGNAGWIGKNSDKEPSYKAHIFGKETTVYGGSSNSVPSNGYPNPNQYDSRQSVYDPFSGGSVSWNQKVNKIGSTNETFDSFKSYISKLSTDLFSLKNSSSVYAADAQDATNSGTYSSQPSNLERSKYDGKYTFKIQYDVNEKVILFKGDGKSSMQVFNLPASMLNNSSSYSGVSFAFENIPDSSSVVINVTGDGAQNITFHNGWRFWWNKRDLGGSYIDPDYAKRAQQIMWNFPQTQNLTIQGGKGTGPITIKQISAAESAQGVWGESTKDTDTNAVKTTDDPAAGLLGSVLVPNGSFESHVSTNGRVWVGNDFSMYNPTAVGDGKGLFVNVERSYSASALDMDQERHNLPWNGSYSTQGAAIAWDKVDASDPKKELPNTTWAVYASNSDAQNQSNALKTVTDNAYGDDDSEQGSFSIGGLNPSAIYYIREVSANNTDYDTNTNIYTITAGGEGSKARVVTNVYDSEGNEIPDSNKKLLPNAGDNSTNAEIANKRIGTSIEWSKVDGTDNDDTDNGKMLSGSKWKLQKQGSSEAYQITDSTKAVQNVEIQHNGESTSSVNLVYKVPVDLTATVKDSQGATDGVPQAVKWTSYNPAVASVNDGKVLGLKNGSATITACSVADSTQCATANITVAGAPADTKNTTTFYFRADGYTSDNTKLHYTLGGPTDSTGWDDAVMTTASGCSNWLTVTIENPDLKAVTYLFYQGSNWYHQGSSTTANFTTAANQTVATVENHAATATAPTGCSAGGGSTTIGSVTISRDQHEVGLGKTIILTAMPNPSSDTVTWYSGNTSVASVEKGPDTTTTTITGLKAGTTTITAKTSSGATASVTITVKDDSTGPSTTNGAYSCGGALGKCDMNTEPGKFRVVDLADGEYTLTEMVAPNGFDAGGEYKITIKNGQVTWDPDKTDNKLPNKRKTGTVTWNKVSSDSANDKNKKLGGSEWKLTKTESFSWNTNGVAQYTAIDQQSPVTITDCELGTGETCSAPAGGQTIYDVDPVEGQFKLTGLEWGTYTLVEFKAPDGYDVDSTVRTFTFGPVSGSDGTGKWNSNSAATGNFTTSDADYDSSVFTFAAGDIKNQPGVILPATGGEGSNKMYAAGFLAVAIAMVGLALSLKRRQS